MSFSIGGNEEEVIFDEIKNSQRSFAKVEVDGVTIVEVVRRNDFRVREI